MAYKGRAAELLARAWSQLLAIGRARSQISTPERTSSHECLARRDQVFDPRNFAISFLIFEIFDFSDLRFWIFGFSRSEFLRRRAPGTRGQEE